MSILPKILNTKILNTKILNTKFFIYLGLILIVILLFLDQIKNLFNKFFTIIEPHLGVGQDPTANNAYIYMINTTKDNANKIWKASNERKAILAWAYKSANDNTAGIASNAADISGNAVDISGNKTIIDCLKDKILPNGVFLSGPECTNSSTTTTTTNTG